MRNGQPAQTRTAEVDALRGVALFGIYVVNVPFLAGVDAFIPPDTVGDRVATSVK